MKWEKVADTEAEVWRGYVLGKHWFSVVNGEIVVVQPLGIGEPRRKSPRTVAEAKSECQYMLDRWLTKMVDERNADREPAPAPPPEEVDLGWLNGWREGVPPLIGSCRVQGHSLTEEKAGKGCTKRTCAICKYTYKIDSGD